MILRLPFPSAAAALALVLVPWSHAPAAEGGRGEAVPRFECGYLSPAEWMAEIRRAVARGEIPDPARREIPPIPEGGPGLSTGGGRCLSRADIIPFEDTGRLLVTNFSNAQLINLMVEAANRLLATHGDRYDFVGYWLNFTPHHTVGTAFYKYIENDVLGIGDPSTTGTPLFNLRPALGLGGRNIEGFVMMWNVNSSFWQPGTGPGAAFTRLVLAQEFEHRFAMYLPDLADGRRLQGGGSCGRIYHWSFKVDGQGSGMEIAEWVGTNPAVRQGGALNFNADTGGVFSWSDLYLMGYASPAEMDAGNSELRFLHDSDCSSPYFGRITPFRSSDIIATAGPRAPDRNLAQKSFRTAWIMIHLPGAPPTAAELDKAVAILEQHTIDWSASTIRRGTMDHSLQGRCAEARLFGCGVNPSRSLRVLSGIPSIGTTVVLGVDNPLGTQAPGSIPYLVLSGAPDQAFPCGTSVPGLGMGGPGAAGELLIGLSPPNPLLVLAGAPWTGPGAPAAIGLPVPPVPDLIGSVFYAQGLLFDLFPGSPVPYGVTDGVSLRVGP